MRVAATGEVQLEFTADSDLGLSTGTQAWLTLWCGVTVLANIEIQQPQVACITPRRYSLRGISDPRAYTSYLRIIQARLLNGVQQLGA